MNPWSSAWMLDLFYERMSEWKDIGGNRNKKGKQDSSLNMIKAGIHKYQFLVE